MKNNFFKISVYLIIIIGVMFGLYFLFGNKNSASLPANSLAGQNQNSSASPGVISTPIASASASSSAVISPSPTIKKNTTTEPISNALARITKKPFGIKVSPGASPVVPEKFSGYHTGVDFETTADEQNIDVSIYAICAGPLLVKKYASGYGGVVVQKCQIAGEVVTIIYGHLRLASIDSVQGAELSAGQKIGVLGNGYSAETDGERKHLHLGIHKGSSIDIKGYVSSQSELASWIDAAKYL